MSNSGQFYRVFLDELGDIQQLPLWVGVMVLTTVDEAQTAEEARALLRRSRQIPPSESHAVIDMVITIVSYRFGQLKRREVEKMLDVSFEKTRVYKEIREEAIAEGRAEGEANIIIRLLKKRFGEVSDSLRAGILGLLLPSLEELGERLLDFESLAEVEISIEERS